MTLTDKDPNLAAFERLSSQHPLGIRYIPAPVKAMKVPEYLEGLRTIFSAFHHFAQKSARLVLQNAVQERQPVGIFEIPERKFLMMVPFLFTLFMLHWRHPSSGRSDGSACVGPM